jgi:hypothetical protein
MWARAKALRDKEEIEIMPSTFTGSVLIGIVIAGVTAACSKRDASSDPPLALAASALAPSIVSPTAAVSHFVIDTEGKAILDMPAPKEHILAETTRAAGELDVDLKNIANTRGEVKVDLTTFATHTFGSDKDKDQTSHARNWLEVGDVADEASRVANRFAIFAIRSIDGASASDVTKMPLESDAVGAFRMVSLTAHGELLLHGRKVTKDAELEVRVRYASGSPADAKPSAIEIKTKKPFTVVLSEHDVKPRDTFGKFAQGSLGLLGTKVAETASVTLALRASPKL